MDDVRDERLGDHLDLWAQTIKPEMERRLPRVYRRARYERTMRWAASMAAVAVFVGAVAWGAGLVGHGEPPPA